MKSPQPTSILKEIVAEKVKDIKLFVKSKFSALSFFIPHSVGKDVVLCSYIFTGTYIPGVKLFNTKSKLCFSGDLHY